LFHPDVFRSSRQSLFLNLLYKVLIQEEIKQIKELYNSEKYQRERERERERERMNRYSIFLHSSNVFFLMVSF
jgi:hypothetical protein